MLSSQLFSFLYYEEAPLDLFLYLSTQTRASLVCDVQFSCNDDLIRRGYIVGYTAIDSGQAFGTMSR